MLPRTGPCGLIEGVWQHTGEVDEDGAIPGLCVPRPCCLSSLAPPLSLCQAPAQESKGSKSQASAGLCPSSPAGSDHDRVQKRPNFPVPPLTPSPAEYLTSFLFHDSPLKTMALTYLTDEETKVQRGGVTIIRYPRSRAGLTLTPRSLDSD